MTHTSNLIRRTLLFYWRHAIRYPRKVWAIIILAPFTLFFHQFLPPLIAARVIDQLSAGGFKPDRLWHDFGAELVIFSLSSMVGGIVLWRLFIYFNWSLEALVVRDISRESFDHYMQLDTNYHSNSFGGSLVSQTNKLASSYVRIADAFQFQIYGLAIALVITSVVLWGKSPLFVGLLWLVTALFFGFSFYLSREPLRRSAVESSWQNKVTGFLADAITNVLAVKSFSASRSERQRFAAATESQRHATNGVMWATLRKDVAAASVTQLVYAGSLIVAVISVVRYSADISTVFLLLSYTANITERLWAFNTESLRNINRGLGDARDGIIALETVPKVLDPTKPEKPRIRHGAISFQNMTFAHDGAGDDSLFENFNLEVAAGEKIGLVGHSGSGKTSLTKLLLRYTDIDSGRISIDGQDIAAIAQDDLRAAISYVPQEPLLFHRSIRENIAYGKPQASLRAIKAIARQANAAGFIDGLPDGYDTLVGERGVKLSGGQRQRIAIARAMLKDAPVLVLDEATSALDSESEASIQEALWRLMENRTAIVIAHRLSTIQKMDRIVVMEDGRIVEQGNHKQLIEHGGTYARLWAHQSGGFIED